VIAILGGLGAAAAWAVATLCSSRVSRQIGAASTLAWIMGVGLLVTVPLVAVAGFPPALDGEAGAWLGLAGVTNVLGLWLVYTAFRHGKVAIVAPIASTEGAVTAVIAVIAGEHIAPGAGVTLGVIVAGVVLASMTRDAGPAVRRSNGRAALMAAGAALAFGVGLYASGLVGDELPIAWVLLPTRAVAVLAIALPLLLTRRLSVSPRTLPLILVAALCEIAGLAAFVVGARHGIAVSVVIASQYAAFAALGAYVLFRERLTPLQASGVGAIAAGVAALTVLQA
jgi:drug/metabolite transporter (DMT)-like permease